MTEVRFEPVMGWQNEVEVPRVPDYGQLVENRVPVSKRPGQAADNRIVAVMPAYNEERFIGSVVLKLRRHAGKVIVIDDGSTDSTAELAAEAGATVVRHPENLGKGAALNTGFRLARDYSPEVVVMLDADGQHLPEELSAVIQPVLDGRADLVVGSRYIERTSHVPRHRIWGHWGFNLVTGLASGITTTDSQSGYRAFSPAAVERIDFRSQGFSVESEMQFIAHDLGLRLLEVPITIRYTDPPKRSVIAHGLGVLNGILHLVGQYRPLLFIGLPGLFIHLAGLAMGVVVVERYENTSSLAAGYAIICLLLTFSGLMMMTTGITLHSIRGLLTGMLKRA
jgi:glycosyltransferase involved in cell wall biosynthesis